MMLSSAKNRWEIRGLNGQANTPWSWPAAIDWFRRADSPSAQKRNKKREIGSPCLKPLDGFMWPQGFSLILREYVTEVIHCIIRFNHLSLKPILYIIFSKQPHSTRSKVYLVLRPSPQLYHFFFIKVMHIFKSNNNIISDEVVRHESTLIFTYNIWQETL